jgi:class 3 adenylate cyclase
MDAPTTRHAPASDGTSIAYHTVGDVTGIAVDVAARISALAGRAEILVSSTVKDLTPRCGLEFEDAGEHPLEGIPGSWRLYRVVEP